MLRKYSMNEAEKPAVCPMYPPKVKEENATKKFPSDNIVGKRIVKAGKKEDIAHRKGPNIVVTGQKNPATTPKAGKSFGEGKKGKGKGTEMLTKKREMGAAPPPMKTMPLLDPKNDPAFAGKKREGKNAVKPNPAKEEKEWKHLPKESSSGKQKVAKTQEKVTTGKIVLTAG